MATARRATALFLPVLAGTALATSAVAATSNDGMELLNKSIALYSTLSTYADTGTAVREQPGLVDRWKFSTSFRRPRDFQLNFRGVSSRSAGLTADASYQHVVIWMINGELQAFNKQLRAHTTVPPTGNQPAELLNASAATVGTSVLIPSLLFSKWELPGTLKQIREAKHAGFESIDGHRCHKIVGTAAQYYPSGKMTNVREVTVWLDAQSLLVRRVFEDTPKGYPAGAYLRLAIDLDPRTNVPLPDANFQFSVPRE
jgi:hypothetical protein